MIKTIKDLNIDELKKNHKMIHFFGLGFIQLKLDQKSRLHFYHPDLPAFVETPHNHRYNFLSKTLKGEITHKFFSLTPGQDWLGYDEDCNKDSEELVDDNEFYTNLKLTHQKTISTGEEIYIDHQVLHTVEANNCITYLERSGYKKEFAQVLIEAKDSKVCPFSKPIPKKKLWELVRSML